MKTVIRPLTAILLALCLCAALAESSPTPPPLRRILDIYCSSRPAELVTAGEVMLTFSIANNSEADARNVYLTAADGMHSEPLGQIPAGDSQTFNRSYTVSEEELDSGEISFMVSHDSPTSGGDVVTYVISTPIARSIPAPRAEFTTQLSADCASSGGTITITYRVRNTGNVPLSQIRVNDALGEFVGRIESLDIGETRLLTSRITVTKPVTSAPSLSYAVPADGGKIYESALSPRTISLVAPELAHTFVADEDPALPGGKTTVILTLYNMGDADYLHIDVKDAVRGGAIASGLSLPAGDDPLVIERTYPVRGEAEYQFHVEGISETGERFSLDTERLRVPAAEAASGGDLTLSAEARTPRIRRGGDVRFAVSLRTDASPGLRGVTLSEESLGPVRNFAIVPGGDATFAEVTLPVFESGDFVFVAEWSDQGGTHIVRSAPVSVTIAGDGANPEARDDPTADLGARREGVGSRSTFPYLMAGGAAALIGLIAALALTTRREHRARRQRARQRPKTHGNRAAPGKAQAPEKKPSPGRRPPAEANRSEEKTTNE